MKKNVLRTSFLGLITLIGLLVLTTHPAFADITNNAIGTLGNSAAAAESGATFTGYFITLWRVLIFVGGLALLFNFINGSLEWIMAGGESGKIQKGRDKIIQSVIGMVILAMSFVIIGFVGQLFFGSNFDLLNLTVPTAAGNSTGTTVGTCDLSKIVCPPNTKPYCNGLVSGCN